MIDIESRKEYNRESRERRRRFAADEIRMARSYTAKAKEDASDGLKALYHELAAKCYRNAYKWKRKADIPVFKET